jgi:hypothetical protein
MEPAADPRDIGLGLLVASARVGLAAGRVAVAPVRVMARTPVLGGALQRVAQDLAADGRVARSRAIAAVDLDRLVDAVLEDPRAEQVLERALASPGLERMVVRVLESRFLDDLTERVLASPEMQRIVEHIAGSP